MKVNKMNYSSHEQLHERLQDLKSVIDKLHKHGEMLDEQKYKLTLVVCGMEKMLLAQLPAE